MRYLSLMVCSSVLVVALLVAPIPVQAQPVGCTCGTDCVWKLQCNCPAQCQARTQVLTRVVTTRVAPVVAVRVVRVKAPRVFTTNVRSSVTVNRYGTTKEQARTRTHR